MKPSEESKIELLADSAIVIHPDILSIWQEALAEVLKREKGISGDACVSMGSDMVEIGSNRCELQTTVSGRLVALEVPREFWRSKTDENYQLPWSKKIISAGQGQSAGCA